MRDHIGADAIAAAGRRALTTLRPLDIADENGVEADDVIQGANGHFYNSDDFWEAVRREAAASGHATGTGGSWTELKGYRRLTLVRRNGIIEPGRNVNGSSTGSSVSTRRAPTQGVRA